ncbi:MAG: hypothetical protein HQ548_00805 [Chloroflexi bacterium]|nr:hypothetical protein [Chloroflexota bacterium]
MSTAVTSLISLVVMLVIAFTALGSVFTVMDATGDTLTAQNERTHIVLRSDVAASAAATSTRLDGHSDVDVTLANQGDLSYALFSRWDVTAHYTHIDGTNESVWAPYTTTLADDSWIVQQIYLDAAASTAEVLEPGLLNPEEEALFRIRLAPPAEPGTTGWITVTPPEGPPTNISFTNPTSLYVLDIADRAVYLYHAEGTYQGSYALDPGSDTARGITVDTRRFFVVDMKDDEAYRYAPGFVLAGTWGLESTNKDSSGITTNGVNVWIADEKGDSVYKYDMDGTFISESALAAANSDAKGIATDGNYIWVVDSDGGSAYKYDMAFGFIAVLSLAVDNTNARGITTNGTCIWMVDDDRDSVFTYDMDMNFLSEFALVAPNANPTGLTVAPR